MKKIIILLSTVFWGLNCFAQTETKNKKHATEDGVFTIVQEPAEFPGGIQGWMKYLQDSLNSNLASDYIKVPKGKKVGRVTVIVEFTIDKNGSVSNVTASETIPKKIHPAFIAEAIRVIEKGPKWIPAKQDDKLVIFRHRQSITWQVTEE